MRPELEEVGGTAAVMADSMWNECVETGQAARVVPDDQMAEDVRILIRDIARLDGVKIRTARIDDTVVVAKLDAAIWTESPPTMRSKLTPAERR